MITLGASSSQDGWFVPVSLFIRSKLFVPGSRPELFDKAMASAADAVSFDLEDAVVESRKSHARDAVAAYLRGRRPGDGKVVIVRINGLSTGAFTADLEALSGAKVDVINVPKIEGRADVLRALDAFTRARIDAAMLANIETPKGVRLAAEIATADPRVAGLQIGFKDLFSITGIDSSEAQAMYSIRVMVRLAAAEGGIPVFDTAYSDVKNPDGFRVEAEAARRLGFTGKSCIHPSQIPIANQVFSPTSEQIARAETIVAASADAEKQGVGAFLLDGQMIDRPIFDEARAVVRLAQALKIQTGQGK